LISAKVFLKKVEAEGLQTDRGNGPLRRMVLSAGSLPGSTYRRAPFPAPGFAAGQARAKPNGLRNTVSVPDPKRGDPRAPFLPFARADDIIIETFLAKRQTETSLAASIQ
jgi:hypothetical protein